MSIDFSSLIDVRIAIILWIIGWLIKHSKIRFIKNLPNDAIPIILCSAGILISCFAVGDVTMNSILIGIITAVFSIGIHSSGKNIFKLAEGTTVFATAEAIKNNLAKTVGEQINDSTGDENPYNSSLYFGNEDVPVDDSLDDDELVLEPSNGHSVG